MFEMTIAIRRKKRTLNMSENATLKQLYNRISKHTNKPEKAHILSIKKIKRSGVTVTAESSAKSTGLMCEMVGCGEMITKGQTFYNAEIEQDDEVDTICVCRSCKTEITREAPGATT